jgi:hypothetical protein
MQCPRCLSGDFTCVLNTVHRQDGSIRRRHGCRACQIRWTGAEEIDPGSLVAAFVPRPVVGAPVPPADLLLAEHRDTGASNGDLIDEPTNLSIEDT